MRCLVGRFVFIFAFARNSPNRHCEGESQIHTKRLCEAPTHTCKSMNPKKIDCHENPTDFLAMTENNEIAKSCNDENIAKSAESTNKTQ